MKKLIVFSVIFALLAGMVFAQESGISFSGWGRGVFAPLIVETAPKTYGEPDKDVNDPTKDAKGENYAGAGVTWGDPAANIGFSIRGNAEFIGFALDINGEGPTLGDHASIWAKPFESDLLKLTVGKFNEDVLRGKLATDTGFEDFVVGALGEDAIFKRFASTGSTYNKLPNGFMLSSAPIDGLFIGFMVNGTIWDILDDDGDVVKGKTTAKDAYRYMQIGLGYNINGIGHIRAQWVGGYAGTDKEDPEIDGYKEYDYFSPARIEAAFALTAVENLLVDVGAKIWMPISGAETKKERSNGIDLGLGASFRANAFSVKGELTVEHMGAYARENEDDKSSFYWDGSSLDKNGDPDIEGVKVSFNLIPAYDLDFATIGLSLGMRMGGLGMINDKGDPYEKPDRSWTQFGFGAFIQKGLGNGLVKAGLAYTLAPTKSGMVGADEKKGDTGSGVFSIPIILEYSF